MQVLPNIPLCQFSLHDLYQLPFSLRLHHTSDPSPHFPWYGQQTPRDGMVSTYWDAVIPNRRFCSTDHFLKHVHSDGVSYRNKRTVNVRKQTVNSAPSMVHNMASDLG